MRLNSTKLRRAPGLVFSLSAFGMMWVFWTCFVAFLANVSRASPDWPTPSIDGGWSDNLFLSFIINSGLITFFSLQHSFMARSFVKRQIGRIMPPELERAAYVHAANLAGFAIVFLWQPIPIPLWSIKSAEILLWSLFALGWLTLLAGALSIDILELLGVRQAIAWFNGRPARPLSLKDGGLFRWVAHPMYIGLLLGVWATPDMSVGHALLASGFTLYILIGMRFEEADLAGRFGAQYQHWRGR